MINIASQHLLCLTAAGLALCLKTLLDVSLDGSASGADNFVGKLGADFL